MKKRKRKNKYQKHPEHTGSSAFGKEQDTGVWAEPGDYKISSETIKKSFIAGLPVLFLLAVLTIALYMNSLSGDFLIADDIPGLVNNPVVTDFQKAIQTNKINIIFDSWLFQIGKGTPYIFHFRSMVMHFINVVLVYVFCQIIFNKKLSLFTALIFLAHPIATETVSWISAWIYLALTMFTLLVAITFFYYRRTGNKLFMAASIILLGTYILFFTDNWVFTIPPIVIVLDQLLVEKKISLRFQVIRNYIPLLLMGILHAVYLITTSLSQRIFYLKNIYYNDIEKATPYEQRIPYTTFMTYKQYIFPRDLTIYHEGYIIGPTLFNVMVFFTLVTTALIIYFLFKNKPLAGLLALPIVALLPSYSPVPVAWLMADRYLYRGGIFFAMLVVYLLATTEKKLKTGSLLSISVMLIFLLFSIKTISRNNDWNSDKNLWLATKNVSPYSARVYNNLGDVYFKEKNTEEAIRHFQIALQLKPDFADVVHNLGYVYLETGDFTLARSYLEKSYEMNPYLYQSLYKLGYLEYQLGNLDKSEEYFNKTLEVNPQYEPAAQAINLIRQVRTQFPNGIPLQQGNYPSGT